MSTELPAVRPAEVGDQREMVIAAPRIVAPSTPPTHLAVRSRLGVAVDRLVRVPPEIVAKAPVDGGVLSEPERVAREVRSWADDVHVLGVNPLEPRDELRVHTDLHDRARARVGGQFGVVHLVRPVSERGRPRHPHEEVGPPGPAIRRKRCLCDSVHAAAHQVDRRGGRIGRLDAETRGAQEIEICLLVGPAALEQDVVERVPCARTGEVATRDEAVQRGQVLAGKVIGEIGRRKRQVPVHQPHIHQRTRSS